MTLFKFTEDDHNRLDEDLEKTKLRNMAEETKRNEERNKFLKIFEPLSDQNEFNNSIGQRTSGNTNPNIIEEITEYIQNTTNFLTIEESKEILYYDKGVYVKGGEVIIEKIAEGFKKYKLQNKYVAEIKGHIMRSTYHKHAELDTDPNIINLRNGLFNIETGEFKEHSPNYLSITQKPIIYDPKAKPKLFGKYLQQVLYATEIRTAIEVMAYTLYKDNPYEIIVKLFGYGANGKSVFTGLLTALHGHNGVSNVPMKAILTNRFALSDMEDKYVNIDTELSSEVIHDTAVLKKLTGRQSIRTERKNQDAHDTQLFVKPFFSTNKIVETPDESDAYIRREIIIGFPNRFEDGKSADPNLLRKLTTEEELSGIFNILVHALQRVLKNGIFINEKTIEERREKRQLAVDPISSFLTDAMAEDSIESDYVTKEEFYEAYKWFCNTYRLAIESKGNFGRIIKGKGYQEDREGKGERRTIWKGIKLAVKYRIDLGQQRLSDIIP